MIHYKIINQTKRKYFLFNETTKKKGYSLSFNVIFLLEQKENDRIIMLLFYFWSIILHNPHPKVHQGG